MQRIVQIIKNPNLLIIAVLAMLFSMTGFLELTPRHQSRKQLIEPNQINSVGVAVPLSGTTEPAAEPAIVRRIKDEQSAYPPAETFLSGQMQVQPTLRKK